MQSATITAIVLERILAFLAPIFLSAAGGNDDVAREAARSALACYNARTNRELRLAALTVAFSFGALDALSKAANPDLAINQIMRLRGNATSLHRSADKAEQALRQERHDPDQQPDEQPESEPNLPDSTSTLDLVAFVNTAAPLSRQQRRLAERQAEKQRQRRAEEARKAQRLAQHRAHNAMAAAAGR